jgi:hypothetical protein
MAALGNRQVAEHSAGGSGIGREPSPGGRGPGSAGMARQHRVRRSDCARRDSLWRVPVMHGANPVAREVRRGAKTRQKKGAEALRLRPRRVGDDPREEEGAAAGNRKPREEEGFSDFLGECAAPAVEIKHTPMLRMHNSWRPQCCYAAIAYVFVNMFCTDLRHSAQGAGRIGTRGAPTRSIPWRARGIGTGISWEVGRNSANHRWENG